MSRPMLLGLVGGLALVLAVPFARAGDAKPAILIDTSMEFLFVYDHLADFLRGDGYTVTQNRGSLRPALLEEYDLVLLQQLTTPLVYDPAFITALERWVSAGGRLLLVGHAVQWRHSNRATNGDFPLNAVATPFGFRFLDEERGAFPIHPADHPIARGTPELDADKYDPRARIWGPGWLESHGVGLVAAKEATPVLVDASGRIVMAAREVGAGRVVAFTGKRLLWACMPASSVQHDEDDIALVRRTLAWLTEGCTPRANPERQPTIRHPDVVLRGKRTTIRTTEVLRERAAFALEHFDRAYDVLYGYFQVPAYSRLTINALPGAGGGWRAGDEIGVAVLSSDDALRTLLLWEMTNGWGPPTPESWGEMWAFHTLETLRGRLGVETPARRIADRHRALQEVIDVDPDLTKLDLADPGDEKTHRKVLIKALFVMEELERMYPGLIPRICRMHRATWQPGQHEMMSMQDFVHLCSLAAGTDLYPFFRSLGTTVEPREIEFSASVRLLERYEERYPDEPKLPTR